jgi:hypothetical protein
MKKIVFSLLLIFLITIPSSAFAKVGLILQRDYQAANYEKYAGFMMQKLTPFLETYGVDYEVFYGNDLGATYTDALNYICDDMDDDFGIDFIIFIGGEHLDNSNDLHKFHAAELLNTSGTFSPDVPMMWVSQDFGMYFDVITGGTTFTASTSNKNMSYDGTGFDDGIPSSQSRAIEMDTSWSDDLTSLDVLVCDPADTTDMYMWRTTGTTDLHLNGWTFLYISETKTIGLNDISTKTISSELWGYYYLIAEIAYRSPSSFKRDRPYNWSIEIDDDLRGLVATTDDFIASDPATDRDWYDTPSLQLLADSLSTWGNVIVNFGVAPDSTMSTEAVAKAPIYRAEPNIRAKYHSHTDEAQKQTTVAVMDSMASAQYERLTSLLGATFNTGELWSGGGQMGTNFATTLTMDSVFVAGSPAGIRIWRSNLNSTAVTPSVANDWDPAMNYWYKKLINGNWYFWYPVGQQTTTDSTAWGNGGTYTDATQLTNRIHGRIVSRSPILILHTPTFSYGQDVSPPEPPGIRMLRKYKQFVDGVNAIAGKTILTFGSAEDVLRDHYYKAK